MMEVQALTSAGGIEANAATITTVLDADTVNADTVNADTVDAGTVNANNVRAPMVPWAWAKVRDAGGGVPGLSAAAGVSAVAPDGVTTGHYNLTISPPLPVANGCVIAVGRLVGSPSGVYYRAEGDVIDVNTVQVVVREEDGDGAAIPVFDVLVFAADA